MPKVADTERWSFLQTFTAASSNVTTGFGQVGVGGDDDSGHRVLRLFAESATSSGSAVITVVIVEQLAGGDAVVYREIADVAVTTTRTGMDGASGNYVCTVTFAVSGRDTFDLLGHLRADTKVFVGVTTLTTITSLKIRGVTSRNI